MEFKLDNGKVHAKTDFNTKKKHVEFSLDVDLKRIHAAEISLVTTPRVQLIKPFIHLRGDWSKFD